MCVVGGEQRTGPVVRDGPEIRTIDPYREEPPMGIMTLTLTTLIGIALLDFRAH